MAIINSAFIGRGRKSAGNATFRTVRGRTIASMKVAKKGSQGSYKSRAQFMMAVISRFAAIKKSDIMVSFDPTSYGSSRNAFFKINYEVLVKAMKSLYAAFIASEHKDFPTDTQILAAVAEYASANPSEIVRVKKAGYNVVYLDGEWTSEQNPITTEMGVIEVSVNESSMGSVSGAGSYEVGATATLQAKANSGYKFLKWNDGNTDNPRLVVAQKGTQSLQAIFAELVTLTFKANPEGNATVSGSGDYAVGEKVVAEVTPVAGCEFDKWYDDNTENPRTFTASQNLTITAYIKGEPDV